MRDCLRKWAAAARAKLAAIPVSRRWLYIDIVAACVAVAVLVGKIVSVPPSTPAPAPMQPAHEAPAVANLDKQPLPAPVMVKAYPKAAAVKRLQLPPEIAADPRKEVISSAQLPPSAGGYVTATVLDTATGDAVTRFTEQPRPWLALGGQTDMGLRYGISTRGGQQATLYARQDLLRVKAVTLSGYGEANASQTASPEAKAQLDLRVSW